MTLSAEELYLRLQQLIETMPEFEDQPGRDAYLWLGRAQALVLESEGGISHDALKIKNHGDSLARGTGEAWLHKEQITAIMYRALARAEMKAPLGLRGAFLPIGKPLDVFATLGKVLSAARQYARIVDPYLDETVVTDFVGLASPGVRVELLAGRHQGRAAKPAFKPAVERFISQHGTARPLEARATDPLQLHDRFIDVDGAEAWIVTQSFNKLAQRSPATISKATPEVAQSKLAWYAALWSGAEQL